MDWSGLVWSDTIGFTRYDTQGSRERLAQLCFVLTCILDMFITNVSMF